MSRKDVRAKAAQARHKAPVSPALLQKRVQELEHERSQLQLMLISIVKDQGRVRVPLAIMNTLSEADGMDAKTIGDMVYLTYQSSNMVTPNGVRDGKPNDTEPAPPPGVA